MVRGPWGGGVRLGYHARSAADFARGWRANLGNPPGPVTIPAEVVFRLIGDVESLAAAVLERAPEPVPPHPRRLEDAAMQLALTAEDVDEHIMDNGLAWRRQRLRDEIGTVKTMVERHRSARAAVSQPGSDAT